jgi:hypothetical protein
MESKPQIPSPRSVSGDDQGSARIGPYHVVRHLVSGPGAQMMEAASDAGEQVLLQIARCRPSRSSADESDKRAMIEAIQSLTEALRDELDILQHGHADSDGETIIFWALPWDERAVELGLAKIEDADELVSVGIHLASRLVQLHARGRLDPLLSERLIVIKGGEPWVAGAPVRVPDRWLSPGMRGGRLAPEETLAKEPTRAGDLWRLGQTLKALTVYLDRLPTRVWRTLELLGHADVRVRVPSAAEALSIMESLADPEAPEPPSISDMMRAKSPLDRTLMDEPHPEDDAITIADEPLASGTRKLLDDSKTEPGAKPPRPLVQVPDGDTLLDFQMEESSDAVVVVEPSSEAPTVGTKPASRSDPDLHPTLDEAAIPQMRKKRGSWDSNPKDMEKGGPTGTAISPKLPPASMVKRGTTLPGAKRIEAPALPRMLPPPGGVLAGPKGTLIGATPFEPRQIMRLPRNVPEQEEVEQDAPTEPQPEIAEEPSPEQAEDDVRVDPVPSPRTAAIAVLTFIVGLLIGAVAAKGLRMLEDDPSLLDALTIVPSSGLVRLEAEPAGSAIVISEEDGRVLGSTPMWVQVPPDEPYALLVTAPDHEPMRVVLPDRGRLRVVLEPRAHDRESCLVNLHVPQNVPVESVGSSIQETTGGFQVPGSGVIRAVGELRGAWLLRCPELGAEGVSTLEGRQLEKEIELRISNPPDMEVWIDGVSVGTSPLRKRVLTGFKQIRLVSPKGAGTERWVPVFGDTEIEFPYPN